MSPDDDERTPGHAPGEPEPAGAPPALPPDAGAVTPDRALTEAEVTRVLRLASEADEGGALTPSGHTVPELMEAAREAGIDPALVARAAAVTEAPGGGAATLALGAPDTRTLRAFVPGGRLPTEPRELCAAVERALGRGGQLQDARAGRLVWREDHTLGRTTLDLVETDDGLEVTLDADRAGHYLGAWFLGVLGWGALAALTPLGALGPVATLAGFLVLPFVVARPFWIRFDRNRRRRLEAAMMAVLERVGA